MPDYNNFDDVFGTKSIGYEHKTVKALREGRAALEGELFIDKLLKGFGLPLDRRYFPPTSEDDIRKIHKDVMHTSFPLQQKCSILYYLVKDLNSNIENPKKAPNTPHRSLHGLDLPPRYKTLIDGLWLLDRLRFEEALDYLTDPALIPTFSDEILYTLCKHSASSSDSRGPSYSLAIAYYQTVSPPLETPKMLEAYFETLASASVTEAYFFARAQGEDRHHELFVKLIEFVAGQPSGEGKAQQGFEVVSLPLDRTEEEWFREVLEGANQKEMKGAADMLVMRDIAMGRVEGLEEEVELTGNRKIEGVNWESLVKGLKSAS